VAGAAPRSHRASPFTGEELAELDTALSLALFRYLSDVRLGRVKPEQVHFHLDLAARTYDLPTLVGEAAAADRLPQLIAEAPPRLPMYRRLQEALARYRALVADATLEPLPVVKKLEPGMPYASLAELRRRLVAVGDLAPAAPLPARYEGELVEATKRFQARHGLDADGIIGRHTFAQLNTPMSGRVRQIELAMERMRWLPPVAADRLLAVNIPEFRLRAFDLRGGAAQTVLRMNVIVGKALDTQTPVFDEDMRYIEFNPYWNVPPSIARGEIVPKLRRDPGYLAREQMDFVGGEDHVSTDVSEANLAAVARGELRIRQRPGQKNALGDIKFVFPNNMNIYLHHTATPRLFQRGRRDFSHGCIRVEEPVALASFVLADQPEWTVERIREAMAGETPRTVWLAHPIPVLVFYTTVIVEEGGRVLFLPDIYGHDRTLDRALRARSPRYQ
jgi:murein L,D-transpeptidase YcbB/YkuD